MLLLVWAFQGSVCSVAFVCFSPAFAAANGSLAGAKQRNMADMKPDEYFKASLVQVFAGKAASEKQFGANSTITKEGVSQ